MLILVILHYLLTQHNQWQYDSSMPLNKHLMIPLVNASMTPAFSRYLRNSSLLESAACDRVSFYIQNLIHTWKTNQQNVIYNVCKASSDGYSLSHVEILIMYHSKFQFYVKTQRKIGKGQVKLELRTLGGINAKSVKIG